MYCVRCKKKTETTNEQLATTSNNRSIKKGSVQYVEQQKPNLSNLLKVEVY